MREKFNQIVVTEAMHGFQRGINLFLEDLNADLERDQAITECGGIDNLLDYLVMESEQQNR